MTKTTADRIDLDSVDRLLKDYKSPEDVLGEDGILKQFTKALLERAMRVEMAEHLGYEKHDAVGERLRQLTGRHFRENHEGRFRRAAHRSPTRPQQ